MTLEERVAALETYVRAIDRSIEKAETALSSRLQGMNEIREAMKDQAGRSPTRIELYAALSAAIAIAALVVQFIK